MAAVRPSTSLIVSNTRVMHSDTSYESICVYLVVLKYIFPKSFSAVVLRIKQFGTI
jgi:hypothetical protein